MYVADKNRYDSMQYRRTGRSGLKLPPSRSGSGTISAAWTNSTIPAPCCAAPSISASPFRSCQQLRPSLRIGGRDLRPDSKKKTFFPTATN